MRTYSITYLLGRSVKGLSRNSFMSFASVLILTSCLLISGCFGLLIYNLYINLGELDALNEIVCICDYREFSDEEIADVYARLTALDSVESVSYVSRMEALNDMREKYSEYPQMLERFTEENNPFSEIYTVKYESGTDATNLLFTLQNHQEFPEFSSVKDKIETANLLESLKNTVLWIFIGFLIILLFISVVIIMNTVRMAIGARSEEIEVMRYIGATKWFISFPFLIESFITAVLSAGIAFGLQFVVYDYMMKMMSGEDDITGLITVVPFADVWIYVLAGFAAVSIITCYIGSKISLRKHVKI